MPVSHHQYQRYGLSNCGLLTRYNLPDTEAQDVLNLYRKVGSDSLEESLIRDLIIRLHMMKRELTNLRETFEDKVPTALDPHIEKADASYSHCLSYFIFKIDRISDCEWAGRYSLRDRLALDKLSELAAEELSSVTSAVKGIPVEYKAIRQRWFAFRDSLEQFVMIFEFLGKASGT